MRGLGGVAESLGGVVDHTHLIVSLSTDHILANFVHELKKGSSVWAAEKCKMRFAWQEGYAAFTVSWTHVSILQRYIANQDSHHRKTGFVDELKRLLQRNGVSYDLRYLL